MNPLLVTRHFRVGFICLVLNLLGFAPALAQDIAPVEVGLDVTYEPGGRPELYSADEALNHIRLPVPGQTPNVCVRLDRVEIGANGLEGYTENCCVESRADLESVDVTEAQADTDGRGVTLALPGIRSGRVIRLRCGPHSAKSKTPWSPEAWHTMNQKPGETGSEPPIPLTRVLVFTKTKGFRHGNIEDGVDALIMVPV